MAPRRAVVVDVAVEAGSSRAGQEAGYAKQEMRPHFLLLISLSFTATYVL